MTDPLDAARQRYQAFSDARILWERGQLDTLAFLREAFIAASDLPALIAEIERLRVQR